MSENPDSASEADGASVSGDSDGSGSSGGSGGSGDLSGLVDVLDGIDDEVASSEDFAVRDVLEAFGGRAFGPLLAAPALIAVSPVGAVPGVPTLLALFIVLVAGQQLFGRSHPWMPEKLLERSVSSDRWDKAHDRFRPWAKRVDRVIKPRLTWLFGSVTERLVAVVAVLLAAMMVPLELLPFAVMVPGLGVLMLGLSITARDGVLAIVGVAAGIGSGYLVFIALSG